MVEAALPFSPCLMLKRPQRPEAGQLMNVRILGGATGPAELERDGPHAIHGALCPP